MTNCKRCGKELKSPDSIKLGYGRTCYRIITLQESKIEIPSEIAEFNDVIELIDDNNSSIRIENTKMLDEVLDVVKFLKCEIKMMKMQMKSMKQNGIVNTTESIERIIKDEERPERSENMGNMANVRKEFEELVSSVSETHQLLTHIETSRPNIYSEA